MTDPFFLYSDRIVVRNEEGTANTANVLASNVSSTTVLNTFPTSTTGSSLGHYHFTEPTTNALKFLNVSGTGVGGHAFYTSNSTTAPIETARFDTNGMTIDKSTAGAPVLVNLPNITISTPTAVVFQSPINQPPWNIVGLGNPIQVLQNTANMQTGITYYLTAQSTQLGQVTTNPDGTGFIDTSDLQSLPQPILAWVNGSLPSVPQIININDDITLTTGTKSCSLSATLLRNSTIKTTLDMDNNTLQFVDALGTTSTVMSSNSYVLTNQPESVTLGFGNNRFFISNGSNITTNIYTGQFQNTNITAGNQTVLETNYLDVNLLNTNQKARLTSASLTLNDLTTNVSILTPTDLTFNGISLVNQVDDNTNDIETNTTDIETLTIKQTTPNLQYISAAITADARPPIAPNTTITQTYAFTPAWYFKNSFASNNKINWYIGGDIGMTVSQVLGLYMNIFNPSMTSNDNCPFIVIYTANDAVPPVNFYKSKRTYIFNQSVTPVINTRYLMFSDVSSTCPTPSTYGSVLNNMELSTVAGSNVGAFAPTEVILAFSIQTNSASVFNSVEFAVNKFGIMTPTGTQEVLFIPST
jgi:hypothetical protein